MVKNQADFTNTEFKESVSQEIDGKMKNTDYFSEHFETALIKSATMQNALKKAFDLCYQDKWKTCKSDVMKILVKAGLWFASIILTVVIMVSVTNKISKQQPQAKVEAQRVK